MVESARLARARTPRRAARSCHVGGTADPPVIVAGDPLTTLPSVLDRVPVELTLCLFHNHTLNQLSEEDRGRFYAIADKHSLSKDVYVLSAEGRWGQSYATFELARIKGGVRSSEELAAVDHHGNWLEWKA